MKTFLGIAILFVALGLNVHGQTLSAYGKKPLNKKNTSSEFGAVSLFVGGLTTFTGRPSLNTVSDGSFEAGLFFGKGSVNFLMTASVLGQSEIVRYDVSGAGMCNTCQNGYILDWQRFLTVNRFQLGLAGQTGSTVWMLSGGLASVQRNVGQWMLSEEGEEFYEITPLLRQNLPTVDFRMQTKSSAGMLSLEVLYLGTHDLAGSSAQLSYLLDLSAPDQFFGIGPSVGVYQHVLTGTEYQLGPELWLGGGNEFKPFALRLRGGLSYNPSPNEGVGWFITFRMEVNRQYKRF